MSKKTHTLPLPLYPLGVAGFAFALLSWRAATRKFGGRRFIFLACGSDFYRQFFKNSFSGPNWSRWRL